MHNNDDNGNVNPYGGLNEQNDQMNRRDETNIRKEKSPLEKLETVPQNTLDQGVCDSLMSQIKGVCLKFSYVLIPRSVQDAADARLKNWDLWGPFFLCLMFAFFINNSDYFLAIMFSVFIGAVIVTFNLRVLGGSVSFFQSVAILGYCIAPLFIALLIIELLSFLEVRNQLINIIIVSLAVVWCVLASKNFVNVNIPDNKKFVALYPIILFYAFLGVLLVYHK